MKKCVGKSYMLKNVYGNKNRNWLLSLLLVFTLALLGWGVSVLIDSFIPLWLLLGFAVVYSLGKFLSYYTRRYKSVGRAYRLILNLFAISLFGLLVWSGISLFTQQFMHSPVVGTFVFLAEIVIFIWVCKVVARNRWRQPSMKLTVFSSICLLIIFAFAGVQPFSGYKDQIFEWVNTDTGTGTEESLSSDGALSTNTEGEFGTETEEEPSTNKELSIGLEVMEKVNSIRRERGSPELYWDDKLYEYSLAHANAMASQKRLFHSSMYEPYAENAWGGEGSKSWTAQTIVNSWMDSDMHRTWLLCPHLRHVAVGVAYSTNGMYAAWTFWRSETQLSDWWYQYTPDSPPSWWY